MFVACAPSPALTLGTANQDSCGKHKHSADEDLDCGWKQRRLHVPVPYPSDSSELNNHYSECGNECGAEVGDQERQGVAHAAKCSHGTAHNPAQEWMTAARQAAII